MDNFFNDLGSLVTSMVALSVGVERITEMAKGFFSWLRTNPDPKIDVDGRSAAHRRQALQGIATLAGAVIAALVGPQKFLPTILSQTPTPVEFWAGSFLLGLMASGGSAFWNHALDIIGAVKTAKENVAKETSMKAVDSGQLSTAPGPSPIKAAG